MVSPSPPASPRASPHLAGAFLALSDGPANRRSPARAAAALLAGLVVAVAAPLGWSAVADGRPADQPVATAAGGGKALALELDEEDEA